MTRRATTVIALACALVMGVPGVATATSSGSASQVINDCNSHGRLTAHYSLSALRQALAQMPADVREYTDCYDVIQRELFAQLGASGSGGTAGSGGSSGSFLPVWLIVVIVVLALAAVAFATMAIRRRTVPQTDPPGPGGPDGPSDNPPASDPGEPRAPGHHDRG